MTARSGLQRGSAKLSATSSRPSASRMFVENEQRITVTSAAKTRDADRFADLKHFPIESGAQKLRGATSIDHPLGFPSLVVGGRDDQLGVRIAPCNASDLPRDSGHLISIEMQIGRMMRRGSGREAQCDEERAGTTHNDSPTDTALASHY